jgi:glycosyltransferase involved in cell wall biosynthesis
MERTLRYLRVAGISVDVLVLNTSRHRVSAEPLTELADSVVSVDVDTSIHPMRAVRNLLMPREPVTTGLPAPSYWIERFLSAEALHELQAMFADRHVDIVQCESLFTAWYGAALKDKITAAVRPKFVLRAHNVEHRIMERLAQEPGRSRMERIYRAHLARRTQSFEIAVSRHMDAIATLTEDDASWFRSVAPSVRTESIPPGVEMPDDALVDRLPQPDTLCILASMEWAPNVEGTQWFAREVLPLIRATRPNVELHIAGRNPGSEIVSLGKLPRVTVHGEVEDAAEFRSRYTVSVVPLFSGSGLRIKILEAMAMGRPVVSTTVGAEGIPATAGEHVLIADDARSFAQACSSLLESPGVAEQIAQRGRALVHERYAWPARISNLVSFYSSLA